MSAQEIMSFLTPGDPAPWFVLPSSSNPNYHFDSVGGYCVVLCFFGSTQLPQSAAVVQSFCQRQGELAAHEVPFFGVSVDPDDVALVEGIENPTFCKFLWDFEQQVSRQYGVCASEPGRELRYSPTTLVLDRSLRVLRVMPITDEATHVDAVMAFVRSLPAAAEPMPTTPQAPVLSIPNVFEPELCQHLIALYQNDGGSASGFMRQIDGKTVEVLDPEFKKRRDVLLQDPELLQRVNSLILRRVKPEIEKAYQFSITRFERHLIACYQASDRGFFNRHRDNTTKGTAHRRFAMSLNLNAGYEGGYLCFPEYGSHLYRPQPGEAIIFSCSLLHEATPVTSGLRFALLSFFYNDEDAKVREQNQKYVVLEPSRQSATTALPSAPTTTKAAQGFQPRKKHR